MFVAGWSSDGSKVMYAAPIAKAHNDLVLVIATLSPDGHGEVLRWEEVPLPQRLDSTPSWGLMGDLYFLHMRHLATKISIVTGSIIKY